MGSLSRTCIKCGEEKPLYEFPVMLKMQSGRSVKCRDCVEYDWRVFEEHYIEKKRRPQ